MLLSLFTMFMHLSLYIRNILLSVMVIDHSVMQTFSIEEKELAWPRIFRMKFSGLPKTKSTKYSSRVFFCGRRRWQISNERTLLSNDVKPVYLISLGRRVNKTVSSSDLSLLTSIDFLVTNFSCSCYTAQTKNKAFRSTDEFFQIHHQIDNIKMGIVFYMKIRTFLQIVRSGKITASQKANLSINKKVVTHEFKICIEHNMLFRLIDKYSLFQPKVLWRFWIYW